MHGIDLGSMIYCEIDNYKTFNCDESQGDKYLISAFNPNIQSLKGVFLSVSRAMANVRISVLTS